MPSVATSAPQGQSPAHGPDAGVRRQHGAGIFDNDLVLLDRGQTEISPGRLYAVGFEDAIYIKRIDKLPGKIILHSVNPAYPPLSLDLRGDCADQFRVIGRVLWSGREYR